MRYGLDPRFRFLICRAIYKGMLRYICFQNKQEPIVQPLPPDRLYTELVETNKVRIGWKAVQDTLEERASPTAYILHRNRSRTRSPSCRDSRNGEKTAVDSITGRS